MRRLIIIFSIMILSVVAMSQNIQNQNKVKEIYFAGGCFWGTEHYFKQVKGVIETEVGYANGGGENPDYKTVSTSMSGFAETVKVKYNSELLSLDDLLLLFYDTIDPTSLNKQGNDVGSQYRTAVFWVDAKDEAIIKNSLIDLGAKYEKPICVECKPLINYYKAEDYHQDYLEKNQGGYCHIPQKLFEKARQFNNEEKLEFKKIDKSMLKAKLSPIQYKVTQENATERPFQNEYWDEFREGIYVDITTGEPLFISDDKFHSDCGWPSFSKPIDKSLLLEKKDTTHGMLRKEIRSKNGDSHLGHVFDDGPVEQGGLRYCINSASLRFIPRDKMKKEGYSAYLKLFKRKEKTIERK